MVPDETYPAGDRNSIFETGPEDVLEVCFSARAKARAPEHTAGTSSCDCGSSPLRMPDLELHPDGSFVGALFSVRVDQ